MSLESKIETLTAAINRLADAMSKQAPVAPAAPAPAAPAPAAPAPAAPSNVTPMPAPPTFAPPAPAAPAGAPPFTDNAGLVQYVMSAYNTLGPEKGMKIQEVIAGLGYQNINDIVSKHYGMLYEGVESLLKGA